MCAAADGPPRVSYARRSIDELSVRYGGVVKLARRDLGITAFGCQVFELPAHGNGPEHSESASGQQELYVNLAGSGWIDVDGERIEFGPRTMIHVTPASVRQPIAGQEGLTYLCVGASPAAPYRAPEKFA
jgi:quercetin dioxygenase-like cupin family protein